jgi:hypothetical protein
MANWFIDVTKMKRFDDSNSGDPGPKATTGAPPPQWPPAHVTVSSGRCSNAIIFQLDETE